MQIYADLCATCFETANYLQCSFVNNRIGYVLAVRIGAMKDPQLFQLVCPTTQNTSCPSYGQLKQTKYQCLIY